MLHVVAEMVMDDEEVFECLKGLMEKNNIPIPEGFDETQANAVLEKMGFDIVSRCTRRMDDEYELWGLVGEAIRDAISNSLDEVDPEKLRDAFAPVNPEPSR